MTELPLSIEDYRELAAFLEQHLTDAQSLTQGEMDGLRLRLVGIYVQTLRDPEPAAKHAEELLRRDAIETKALELTTALLDLYRDVGNPAGALGFIEPLVVSDPGNDGLRRRYIDTAASLGEQLRAAEVLRDALRGPRGADVHERVGFDLGTIYVQEGELRQARQAFLDVVLLEAGGPETLGAARRLLDLEPDPGDPELVASALEAIAKADPDPSSRHAAATRLLSLHSGNPLAEPRVALAFQTLVDSPRAEEALAWLQAFYERSGDTRALASVVRKRATLAGSPADAQALAVRSIKLVWGESTEEAAMEEWLWLVGAFGPHAEAHAKLIAFFARAGRWEEHCRLLEADIELAPPGERAQRLMQLGQARLEKLRNASAALAAFGGCLAVEPTHEAARKAVESLMAKGDERLAAAQTLEPIYRTLGLREGELRALETRAELAPDAPSRASALAAAVDVAAGLLADRPEDSRVRTRSLALCRRALEEDPSSPQLLHRMDELLSGRESSGDWLARHEAALKRATDPDRRRSLMLAIVAALTKDLPPDRMLGVCRRLIDEPGLDPVVLRVIADTARDEDDRALQRRALELLTGAGDAETSKQAHERLGDLLFLEGDRRAAAESWRPAAHLCDGNPAERQHAQLLYERVLEALPDDSDAAQRLSELYAQADDWLRIPEVLRVLIRADDDRRPIHLLLRLEKSAIEAGAVDEFVSLADEVLARVGADAPAQVCDLKRARARALRSDPARHDEAVRAYRDLVESSQSRKDIDEFESFVESSSSAEERHQERRWLYEWHAAHSDQPADVLTEWATAEEENGETDAAIAIYRRLSETDPSRIDAFEAMCRLKFQAGDFEGGLAVLPTLGEGSGTAERRSVHLRMARLLLDELGRPAEAAAALAPLIGSRTAVDPARQMALRMLADPGAGGEVAERLERFASAAGSGPSSRIFEFLVESRVATAAMAEGRQRWLQRLVEVKHDDPAASLSAAVKGAVELPEVAFFWDAAERIAREIGQADVVAGAYHDVLVDGDLEPAFAEALARRMVTFEGECATQSSRVTSALLKVLERAPGARWALDRVKLALGSQARYGELFRLYDGAIATAQGEAERGELLEEAAFAARDLAGEPERAIPYLETIRDLRPDDSAVDAALERLYERQGQKIKLVELYDRRLEKASGFELRELRRKIASLRVDLGALPDAVIVVEQMLEDDGAAPEVVDLLERVAGLPAPESDSPTGEDAPRAGSAAQAQERAIALLRRHYDGLGRAQDVVRVAERQLALSDGAERRAACERDLIRILERLFESDGGEGIASKYVERLAQLLDATGQHSKLARLWEDQAVVRAKTETAAEQSACFRRAAELWERQEDWARAIEAYRRGAALESEACFEALARIYGARGAWADAASALDWLQANGSTQDRGLLAIRSAEAYVELRERDRARACLEDALRAVPEVGHVDEVRERLLALYRQDAVWKPLALLLASEARRLDDCAKKIRMAREASELLRHRLDDPAGAAALLEQAVGWDPNDEALRLSLVDLLEVLERWEPIVATLTDQIKGYGDHRSRDRALAHHRLARALVRWGQPKEALAQLRLAAEMLPAHPGILSDLGRVAMEVGDLELSESTYRVLLLTLQHKTEDLGTVPPHRADVLLELSEVALRRGDSVRANDLIDSAFEALESGDDPGGLEKTLEARGRHDALARAIERRLERASELPARSIALADLVGLWIGHLGRSADLGSRILHHAERIGRELDHDDIADAGAQTALACVYASLGNSDQALVFLESAIARLRPGERFADCLERWIPIDRKAASALALGLLERRDRQGDQAGAARALEIGFSADPQNAAFHDRMLEWLRTCRAGGDHREAIRLLDGAIANSREDSDLLSQRASVRADLGDDDGAIADLERASVVDTQHVDALVELLVRVHGSASPATDAHAIRLVDLLTRANRPAEARRELERLLVRSPDHAGGLERIAALAFAEGNWGAAAEAYGKLLPTVAGGNRDEVVRVVMAMADACEHAGRLVEAREALDRAFAVAPSSPEIAERLERTCEKLGDWTALARLLQARADEQSDAVEKTRLLLRAGQLLLERAQDPSSALAVIERARVSGPESMDAALLWSRAQMALGRPREALAVLTDAAERGRGRRTTLLARVYLEMGRAHLAMDELVEALVALKSALSTNGRIGEIAMLLGLVAIDLDESQTAERALLAVTTMASRKEDSGEGADPALKAAAFYRLASMAHEKGELAKARRLASRAVGGDPEHQAARALLESIGLV